MTPEQRIKALAELDGWRWEAHETGTRLWRPDGTIENNHYAETWRVPNYLTSYDAIIPLIQKQDKVTQCEFLVILFRFYGNNEDPDLNYMTLWPMTFALTPSQLCEALLRATGKWKE